jgi:hypothetical protein
MHDDRMNLVFRASGKLLFALIFFTTLMLLILCSTLFFSERAYIFPTVVLAGFIGALVSLQRRLKELPMGDLRLVAESKFFFLLAPFSGGLLASVLYLLFLAGLLAGELFPTFVSDSELNHKNGFFQLLHMQSGNPKDYAKLLFWSFVAGFSEKLVVDIIGRFENRMPEDKMPLAINND